MCTLRDLGEKKVTISPGEMSFRTARSVQLTSDKKQTDFTMTDSSHTTYHPSSVLEEHGVTACHGRTACRLEASAKQTCTREASPQRETTTARGRKGGRNSANELKFLREGRAQSLVGVLVRVSEGGRENYSCHLIVSVKLLFLHIAAILDATRLVHLGVTDRPDQQCAI